jgi:hypothetical protein
MVATMPIGAVLGSLFSNPSSLGFVFVPIDGAHRHFGDPLHHPVPAHRKRRAFGMTPADGKLW